MKRERTDDATANDERDGRGFAPVTRRRVRKGAAGLLALGLGGVAFTNLATQPALASSGHDDWVAEGAEITTHDESVEGLTFGDSGEGDGLHVSWSGLNADDRAQLQGAGQR
jgi:hypothetical protein